MVVNLHISFLTLVAGDRNQKLNICLIWYLYLLASFRLIAQIGFALTLVQKQRQISVYKAYIFDLYKNISKTRKFYWDCLSIASISSYTIVHSEKQYKGYKSKNMVLKTEIWSSVSKPSFSMYSLNLSNPRDSQDDEQIWCYFTCYFDKILLRF